MAEALEEEYTYDYKLALIKCIYCLIHTYHNWFKQYINNLNLNTGFKQCKSDTYLLYMVNELVTSVVIIYVYYTLSNGDGTELLCRLEYTKKQYKISSMFRLEEFLVCTIKYELTKMTIDISQPYLIKKWLKGLMTT